MSPYDTFMAFVHNTFVSFLLVFVGESLFVGLIMWAEARAKRDVWEQQETRKMKAVRK